MRTAVKQLQKDYATHDFYSYVLYTCGEHSYIILTASSEQGLTQIAQTYLNHEQYNNLGLSLEIMKAWLRHSPADSPLHGIDQCIEPFVAINNELESRSEQYFDIYSENKVVPKEFEKFLEWHDEQFNTICVGVLQRLADEGYFGVGLARQKVVLNLLMGDQSDWARCEFAKRINPPEVFTQYEKDLNLAIESYREITRRSRS